LLLLAAVRREIPQGAGIAEKGTGPFIGPLWPSGVRAGGRGAPFKDLFVNEHGVFVYLHGHLILQLCRLERVADGRCTIDAFEDG
jgi:hypothetical protein